MAINFILRWFLLVACCLPRTALEWRDKAPVTAKELRSPAFPLVTFLILIYENQVKVYVV